MRKNRRKFLMNQSKLLLGIVLILLILVPSTGCSANFTDSSTALSGKIKTNQTENQKPQQLQSLKVTYLDVGQADSILIQIPNGKNLLIDAGNNEDADFIISYLKSLGIRRLDTVIGTHPHEDHIGSLDKVIQTFEIGEVLMPKVTSNTQTFKEVLMAIQDKGLTIREAKAGLKLDLGEKTNTAGTQLIAEVIAPQSSKYVDMNNYSIVLRLVYGQTAFLFTGDAEDISEREMLSSSYSLKADVLKIGHHGSASSTTQEFLQRVSPKYAVIQVGRDNTYGHPAVTLLNRLEKMGIEVHRTDISGTIIAESDGTKIIFKNE